MIPSTRVIYLCQYSLKAHRCDYRRWKGCTQKNFLVRIKNFFSSNWRKMERKSRETFEIQKCRRTRREWNTGQRVKKRHQDDENTFNEFTTAWIFSMPEEISPTLIKLAKQNFPSTRRFFTVRMRHPQRPLFCQFRPAKAKVVRH